MMVFLVVVVAFLYYFFNFVSILFFVSSSFIHSRTNISFFFILSFFSIFIMIKGNVHNACVCDIDHICWNRDRYDCWKKQIEQNFFFHFVSRVCVCVGVCQCRMNIFLHHFKHCNPHFFTIFFLQRLIIKRFSIIDLWCWWFIGYHIQIFFLRKKTIIWLIRKPIEWILSMPNGNFCQPCYGYRLY